MNSKYKIITHKDIYNGDFKELIGIIEFSQGDLKKLKEILEGNQTDSWASNLLDEIDKQFKKLNKEVEEL